jgi:uncharacterized damage-inducible protein DinB
MKKLIEEYTGYNHWANQRLVTVLEKLSDEMLEKEISSSFSSIKKTLLHVIGAQEIWIRRMEGVSPGAFPTDGFSGTVRDLLDLLLAGSLRLKQLAQAADEAQLLAEKKYATLKGGIVTSTLYQVLAHVVNHGTYHRGQLVTLFRQVGVTDIPAFDLIFFYRDLQRNP